jgi:N-acetylglucosamine malate deacetylase 2
MKILYIYPHPDDESFGMAHAMHRQLKQGHEVYLFTLTKGGATRQRFKYNLSIEEMGEVRYKEMLEVEKVIGLTGMKVLDLPDSGLKEMDPREIEKVIREEIERIKPEVVVTYPVHGISGFHDHIISHAVVKRVFVELKEEKNYLRRLAFHTISEEEAAEVTYFKINGSKPEEIDCIFEVEEEDIEIGHKALDCYVTFKETIDNVGIKDHIRKKVRYEFYRESFDPPVKDIFEKLPKSEKQNPK